MISKRQQYGFLSLDMAISLIVLSIVITLATMWQIKQMDAQEYRITADHQRTIAEAQSKYLKDNFSAVLANATATAPVQITVPMLINTHHLPAGFSPTNTFGQTVIGLARKPNPNQLEVIVVTTGGQTIPEMGIRSIAEHLGGPGGFISSNNPDIVQGVRGGWQVSLSNYAIAPGPGHTASALFLMDGALANDYLYRNAVPNHPELNVMNTDLGMGGHDINNAGAISASGNVATSGDLSGNNVTASATVSGSTANITGETYTGGWFRSRGDTGWYSEKWGGGIYQSDPDWLRIYNNKSLTTDGALVGGQIFSIGNMTSSGRLSTSEFLSIGGIASEGARCSDNKLIAKTAAGAALSCENGFWKTAGSKDRWGGSFWTATHSGGCANPNPYTGSCSCPAGYQPSTQFAIQIGGCQPCISFMCFKPD